MSFVRTVKRENPFVQLDKHFLEDNKLSLKAKGLLAYFLSKPDGWQIRLKDVENKSTDGSSSIRSGLKELMDTGYINRYRERDEEGKFGDYIYEVYERAEFNPKLENRTQVENEPKLDFPIQGNPTQENPTQENRSYSNNDFSNNDFSNKEEEEEEANLHNLISFFKKNISNINADLIKNDLADWLKVRDYDFIVYEITECAKLGAKSFKYVSKAFNESISRNLVSIDDLKKKYEPKPKKQSKAPRNGFKRQTRTEKLPDWYESRNNDKKQVENNSNNELEARRNELLKIQAKYQKEKDVK